MSKPSIKGLSHITFRCHDLEKSAHFLQYVLDAELIYDSAEQTFSISKEKFFLIAGMWIAIMEGEPLLKSYNHVAFLVDANDIPIYKSRIEELRLEILSSRSRNPAEGESLYFYDYDGHLFELHTGDLETRLEYYSQASAKNAG
ncbi:MAG: FosX/FosE/FosI family fosfomycin resistance hydrolase [Gammaproteobacteria bacterium]|nr:FosX/FosE/FosI family fosfomycin resistance hydrolase [Gammaproteobacteria bacterium]